MPQIPAWYALARDQHARLIVEGEETKQAALVSLRMLIRDTHAEFGNKILDDWNGAELGTAIAAAQPKPVEIPHEAVVALADRKSVTVAEANALAGGASHHADAVVKEMVSRGLAEQAGGRITITEQGTAAAEEARIWDLQATLFPFVPVKLKATVSRWRPTPFLTGHELDMAKNILENKIKHSVEGSQAELANFTKFYEAVRPLIGDQETVAVALGKLTAKRRVKG
jgi:hypothetical protein